MVSLEPSVPELPPAHLNLFPYQRFSLGVSTHTFVVCALILDDVHRTQRVDYLLAADSGVHNQGLL